MTWNAFHNRGETLRDVIAAADDAHNGILPMDVPGVADTFTDELDLLSALLLKWHARLSGNIERELMAQPIDLEAAAAKAWRRSAQEMPGLRLIIDRYTEAPVDERMGEALNRSREREWTRLALAAGRASHAGPQAAKVGHRIEIEARNMAPVDLDENFALPGLEPEPHTSFVDRIKAVLVA